MKLFASTYRAILLLLIPWMAFVSRAQNPQWDWARSFGTGAEEEARQVVVDPATHHIYVVGVWEDDLTATFPGGANPSTRFDATYGLMDGFVAKFDQYGSLVWAFKVGGENDDQINSIALDQGGNIYITGSMGEGSSIYFSGTSPHTAPSTLNNASFEDFFLAKYNPDGAFQWVRRSASEEGFLKGLALATSSAAVYAAGIYNTDTSTFGPLSIDFAPQVNDIFLIKYNLDGDEQWLVENGTNKSDVANAVVADDAGVYLLGTYTGANMQVRDVADSTILSLTSTSNNAGEIYIAGYDTNGNVLWGRSVQGAGDDQAFDIAMDADSLYFTGAIDDDADFPGYAGNPLSTSAQQDIFLASLSKADTATGWVQVLPCTNPGDERGRGVDVDAFGNLYVTGDYSGDLQFPGGVTLSSAGAEDVFVASYSARGDFRWAESAGSSALDAGQGLAAGPMGSIYVAGRHDGQMTLGSLTLPDNPGSNGFLAKLQDTLPPPSNDTPCAALLLPVGDTCASQFYYNLGASDSGIPDPGCGSYAGGDVWFKAVVPPSGNLFVGTQTTNDEVYPPVDGFMWSVALALYTGNCGTLTLQACYESNSAYNSRASSAYLSDQVPGDTIWIRVWEPSGDDNGMFSICCYDPGHFPGWDLGAYLCEENGPVDLDATLSGLKTGFADVVVDAVGIPDAGNALGAADGNGATLEEAGDRIILDLTDTIPAGETYLLQMRSNPLVSGESLLVFKTSTDNITYRDHSFQPEASADLYAPYFITAEHPTRFLWIETMGGGGGFHLDGAEYSFRATRGGTWTGPGVTGSTFDPSGLQGSITLTYSVGGSTTRTDSIRTIYIGNSDAGTLGNDTTVCSGSINLQLELQGTTGSVIGWQSSTDAFLSSTSIADTNPFLAISALTQTTWYRAIVQDGGCEPDTSNVVTVTVVEQPHADPGPYADACGSSLGLQANLSAGTGVWSLVSGPGNAVFSPSENDPAVSVDVDQYGIYTFAWTETNGICSDDSLFTVEFYEQPVADPGAGGPICSLDFGLNATPSVGRGQWSLLSGPGSVAFLPADTVPDAVATASQEGTYTLQWTETNGSCTDQASIEVTFIQNLVVEAGPDLTVCGLQHDLHVLPENVPGTWITVYGPGNVTFSPSETDPMAGVRVDVAGAYLFRWEAALGPCTGEDSVLVTFHREPTANAGPDQVLDFRFSTFLAAEPLSADVTAANAAGTWTLVSGSGLFANPSDPGTQVTGLELGENVFQWTVSSEACPDVWDQVIVRVNDVETYTVITPNNDGFNDKLVFPGIEELRGCEIIIFNRWGMEVYRNADYQNNWDGRDYNDRELTADTYYYILRIPPDRIIKSFVEIRRSQ